MALASLQDLYQDHIQDLYSAETQILDALPKMAERAAHTKLRDGFSRHLQQTRQHVLRLESIARRLGIDTGGRTCKGIQGLLDDGSEIVGDTGDQDVVDAALIAAAQRVEHFEIAAYGCARAFAESLGLDEDVATLQQTLDEEGQTNEQLTRLAETLVNPDAQKNTGTDHDATFARDLRVSSPEHEARP
jgi:ferritin-like metal-binding protein YciE